jgi:hypothetical protein
LQKELNMPGDRSVNIAGYPVYGSESDSPAKGKSARDDVQRKLQRLRAEQEATEHPAPSDDQREPSSAEPEE